MKNRLGKHRPPTPEELTRERVLDAVSRMRTRGLSLTDAAREAGTTPATVKKYAPQALRKVVGDGYAPTRSDRYARTLYFLTERGKVTVTTRDSRTASRIARYWAAVDHYLTTGKTNRLRPFRGVTLTTRHGEMPFITDPRVLNRLARAGEVSFEELYALRG